MPTGGCEGQAEQPATDGLARRAPRSRDGTIQRPRVSAAHHHAPRSASRKARFRTRAARRVAFSPIWA